MALMGKLDSQFGIKKVAYEFESMHPIERLQNIVLIIIIYISLIKKRPLDSQNRVINNQKSPAAHIKYDYEKLLKRLEIPKERVYRRWSLMVRYAIL